MNIKPVLKENDWSTIIEVANKGEGQNYWRIGDEIDLTLSGTFNETVTLQIWDFDHYDKSDGTGKAHILFGMKDLMKDRLKMNASDTNIGGWNDSYMKNTIMNDIYNSIPVYIRNHIKEVNTYANKGSGSWDISEGLLSKDKVFIPGISEIYDRREKQYQIEIGQSLISIFKDKKNRIKKMNNGSGIVEWWWTRSPICGYSDYFRAVNTDGGWNTSGADFSNGVCFCFNI